MISSNAVRQIRRKRRQSSRRAQKEHLLRSTARSDIFTESEEESDHCDLTVSDPEQQDNVDVAFSALKVWFAPQPDSPSLDLHIARFSDVVFLQPVFLFPRWEPFHRPSRFVLCSSACFIDFRLRSPRLPRRWISPFWTNSREIWILKPHPRRSDRSFGQTSVH